MDTVMLFSDSFGYGKITREPREVSPKLNRAEAAFLMVSRKSLVPVDIPDAHALPGISGPCPGAARLRNPLPRAVVQLNGRLDDAGPPERLANDPSHCF